MSILALVALSSRILAVSRILSRTVNVSASSSASYSSTPNSLHNVTDIQVPNYTVWAPNLLKFAFEFKTKKENEENSAGTALYYTTLYCAIFHCTELYLIVLYCFALLCTVLKAL